MYESVSELHRKVRPPFFFPIFHGLGWRVEEVPPFQSSCVFSLFMGREVSNVFRQVVGMTIWAPN